MEHPTFYRTIRIDGLSIFLQRGRLEKRADASLAARTSLFIADHARER
jgi:hypothetical protein